MRFLYKKIEPIGLEFDLSTIVKLNNRIKKNILILLERVNIYKLILTEVSVIMLHNYTAKYIKISSGYMGQLVEWPEVITEGKTLEECREMLKDALQEMIISYRQQGKEIPIGGALLEQVPVEV